MRRGHWRNNEHRRSYFVEKIGEGLRILPGLIVEKFTRRPEGELELLSEGSTIPVAETRTHAGIVKVKRYAFDMR